MTIGEFKSTLDSCPETEMTPALFVGHGSPMNAIEHNSFTEAWGTLGKKLPTPKAILVISAHWLTEGIFVHIASKPKTIHDFWGFPKELYDITYPCDGTPQYAEETKNLVSKTVVRNDADWGIDHGTWVPLHHMYPDANIPVFQMSIDMSKPSQFHFELGQEIAKLRTKGVLIMGSGNIVHNLGNISWEENATPFDWALTFDEKAKGLLTKGDHTSLIAYEKLGHEAVLSIPTPDHYWPLLYILGTQQSNEALSFPVEGITHGSISMRAVQIGG